jgi:hypothetical protein
MLASAKWRGENVWFSAVVMTCDQLVCTTYPNKEVLALFGRKIT